MPFSLISCSTVLPQHIGLPQSILVLRSPKTPLEQKLPSSYHPYSSTWQCCLSPQPRASGLSEDVGIPVVRDLLSGGLLAQHTTLLLSHPGRGPCQQWSYFPAYDCFKCTVDSHYLSTVATKFILGVLSLRTLFCLVEINIMTGLSIKLNEFIGKDKNLFIQERVCLFVCCLSSQQHASVSQGWIYSDNCTCCHTEIEGADQTFYLIQSLYTDTGSTSPSADPKMQGAWQGHWSANF